MTISKIGLASGAAAALFGLGACGTSGIMDEDSASAPPSSTSAQPSSSETSSTGSASSGTAQTVSITIEDFKYQTPAMLAPGAKVTVTNKDSAHPVTADDRAAFDVTVPGNGSAIFTAPSTPGTFAFHCTFHANMQGTLVVKT